MKVFLTGATGLIGSAVLPELLNNGHEVYALVRSEEKAQKIEKAGAIPVIGSLDDIEVINETIEKVDGVIHLAFNNDFSQIIQTMHGDFSQISQTLKIDQEFVRNIGDQLQGTDKPFVITSAIGQLPDGILLDEHEKLESSPISRVESEEIALSFAEKGVRVSVVRPAPTVHSTKGAGFVSPLIKLAQQKGQSGYPPKTVYWSSVNLLDLARLYRLALEKGAAGSVFHGVGEPKIALQEIASAIGERLNVPTVKISDNDYYGFLTPFVNRNMSGNNELTRSVLNWNPTHIGLLEEIRKMWSCSAK